MRDQKRSLEGWVPALCEVSLHFYLACCWDQWSILVTCQIHCLFSLPAEQTFIIYYWKGHGPSICTPHACKLICFKELRSCRTSSKSPRFLCLIKLLKETHHRSFDKETMFLVTGYKRNKCSCPYMTYPRSSWISGDLEPTSVSGWQPDHQEP